MLAAHGTRRNPRTGAFEPPSASTLGRLPALLDADQLGAALSACLAAAALDPRLADRIAARAAAGKAAGGGKKKKRRRKPPAEPHLVVLDVIAADVTDRRQPGLGDHPAGGELAQRVLGRIDAGRGQERAQLPQVAAHHRGHPGRRSLDLGPLGPGVPARRLPLGADRALTGQPPLARPASG